MGSDFMAQESHHTSTFVNSLFSGKGFQNVMKAWGKIPLFPPFLFAPPPTSQPHAFCPLQDLSFGLNNSGASSPTRALTLNPVQKLDEKQ